MNKLSAFIPIRDGNRLEYPWKLCVQSLLPVADEIVLCDGESTDGTTEEIVAWAEVEPKIRLVTFPWKEHRGYPRYNVRWMNYARERLTHEMMLHMDADEILDDTPECHEIIRHAIEHGHCRRFDRLNFWKSPKFLVPEGHYLGRYVCRLGPSRYFMPCDEPRDAGEARILDEAEVDARVKIFHVGFLRKPEAFYEKAKLIFARKFDRREPALALAQLEGKPQWEAEYDWAKNLEPYTGHYPEAVAAWFKQQGFET